MTTTRPSALTEPCTHGSIAAAPRTLREDFRLGLRERILDVVSETTLEQGWRHVRLAEVSRRAQMSRATLYRQFGTKDALADALMTREARRALVRVRDELGQSGPWETSLRSALETALRAPEDQPLLAAVFEGGQENTALLPLLATGSATWLAEGRVLLTAFLRAHHPRLTDSTLEDAADVLVRAAVSHLLIPAGPGPDPVERLLRLARRLLVAPPDPSRVHHRESTGGPGLRR